MLQRFAVFLLWTATGRQFGICETTYRPCRRDCNGSYGWPLGAPWIPWRINDQWVNLSLSCSRCPGECGCGGAVSEIRLPQVQAVTGVRIEGVDLVPEDVVAVYNRNRIVRVDGEQWPGCQNLAAKDGAGTWSVTVQQGLPVPDGGEMIAGMLACELAKACVGASDCRLPRNVQQLARQGVTVGFRDLPSVATLETGIYEVDLWVGMSRYAGSQAPSVRSPDVPRPSVMTWPVGVGA